MIENVATAYMATASMSSDISEKTTAKNSATIPTIKG